MNANGTVLEVPRDAEPYSEIPEFSDFLDYPQLRALGDYGNAFSALILLCTDLDNPSSRAVLRSFQKSWIPPVADYFAIKAISNGISMHRPTIEVWNGLPESEREKYRKALHFRHLSHLSETSLKLLASIDSRVLRMMSLFAVLEVPENPTTPLGVDAIEILEEIFTVADGITSILNVLRASANTEEVLR